MFLFLLIFHLKERIENSNFLLNPRKKKNKIVEFSTKFEPLLGPGSKLKKKVCLKLSFRQNPVFKMPRLFFSGKFPVAEPHLPRWGLYRFWCERGHVPKGGTRIWWGRGAFVQVEDEFHWIGLTLKGSHKCLLSEDFIFLVSQLLCLSVWLALQKKIDKNKLGLSWAKLSCQLGFGCTVINICCLILINMK